MEHSHRAHFVLAPARFWPRLCKHPKGLSTHASEDEDRSISRIKAGPCEKDGKNGEKFDALEALGSSIT